MLRKITKIIFSLLLLNMLMSCATSLPMTSSINDFVMMGTKTNTTNEIKFHFSTKIMDGLVKPFNKNQESEITGHAGYNHTESSTLNRMLKEYLSNKFSKISESGDTKIEVTLKDFWIEQYSTDSGGSQFAAVMFGGEINNLCVANLKLLLKVEANGKTLTKNISVTSEDNFVQGIGTGTSTSNVYRGSNSIEYVHARNINKVNNKALMLLNSYFEEIGL